MTDIQIKSKDNQLNYFSKEKITIQLFELMCYIGEPNLKLAEKIASTIEDKLQLKNKSIFKVKELKFIIKEVLKDKHLELLQAFILRKNKSVYVNSNLDLRYEILKVILNLDSSESVDNYFLNIKKNLDLSNNGSKDVNNSIFKYIKKGFFYPSTTILENFNSNYNNLFSAYNLVLDDNLESIFSELNLSAIIEKRNSSVSINLDKIRSKNELINSINKKACGPIKVMELFNSAHKLISYNSIVNSNNLFYINIENQDIFDFIKISSTLKDYNFAVVIPDRFMIHLINDSNYKLKSKSSKIAGKNIDYTVNTKSILDYIITTINNTNNNSNNINLLFANNLESKNNFSKNYELEISAVGLQPIFKNNSFISGVIDVSKFVTVLGKIKLFDWNRFKKVIMDSIIFLDNCIDTSYYINEVFENNIKNTRQIYLSITGYATLLSKLDISFNSEDSLLFGEKLSEFVSYYSKYQSMIISKQKGPFLKYIKSKFDNINFSFKTYTLQKTLFNDPKLAKKLLANKPKVDWDELKNNIKKYGIRNSTTYSVIDSQLFSACNDCSNAINPLQNFKNIYVINNKSISKTNSELLLINNLPENASEDFISDTLTATQKKIFIKSEYINPLFLIKLQNAFEKYSDGVCNIDINLDGVKDISKIRDLIILSYNLGNCVFSFKNKPEESDFKLNNKRNRKSI